MKKYCVVERNFKENHAGSKARNDVADILMGMQFQPLYVHHSEEKGVIDKLCKVLVTAKDWRKISCTTEKNALLFIQYPLAMYPKVSMAALPFIRKMKKKGVKIVLLIHDLESLRGNVQKSEALFLELADEIIAHNPVMISYLKKNGYDKVRIHSLGIFDYLMDEEKLPAAGEKRDILIAGNLRKEKAGYLYHLTETEGNLKFHLFGPNYSGVQNKEKVIYHGQFSPEELPVHLKGGFGLVWDGESLDCCSGSFGEYMKYNNPHKVSLYLASGIPVIIWKKAALAGWIEKHGLGLVIESLTELPNRLEKLTDQEYLLMRDRTEDFGKKLRAGGMLQKVVGDINENKAGD